MSELVKIDESISEHALATAAWAKPTDINAVIHKDGGIWTGKAANEKEDPVGFKDDRHALIVAGSRSGKGTSAIVPNLCLWPGSMVVIDPKGENAVITAARRGAGSDYCDGLDQRTFVLDPFKAAKIDETYRACFNPLDALDPESEESVDDAARIADALVISQNTNDPFWDEQAKTLLKGLILHIITHADFEGRRNLVTVRKLITSGDTETRKVLEDMGEKEIPTSFELLFEGMRRNEAFEGIVAGSGETFSSMALSSSKTLNGVLSAAGNHTEFIDSLPMQRLLAETTPGFSLSQLKTDPQGISIFLSLPQRFMNTHFRWLRMMTSLVITEMEKTPGQPQSGHPVLLLLDEFAGLKKMDIIENAAAQIAGFGVKMCFVVQTLTQLKNVYKDNWEIFVGNAGIKLFFGIDDKFTREYISKYLGETEIIRKTKNASETKGTSRSQTVGSSSSTSSSTTSGTSSSTTFGSNSSTSSDIGLFWNSARSTSSGTSMSYTSGSNQSSSNSSSFSTNQSETAGENESQTAGMSEGIHKRALLTPDEVGFLFSRIDEKDNPGYPGLALALATGKRPMIVRRTNYYEERTFERMFDPHPEYGLVPLSSPEPQVPLAPPPPNIRKILINEYGIEATDRVYNLVASMRTDYPTLRKHLDNQDFAAESILRQCEKSIKIAADDGRAHTMPETLKACEVHVPKMIATDPSSLTTFTITYGDEPKAESDGSELGKVIGWVFIALILAGVFFGK